MKVSRSHIPFKRTSTVCTFIPAMPDATRPKGGASSTEREFIKRLRRSQKVIVDYTPAVREPLVLAPPVYVKRVEQSKREICTRNEDLFDDCCVGAGPRCDHKVALIGTCTLCEEASI